MSVQGAVWLTTFAGVMAVSAVFIYVISRSGQAGEPVQVKTRAYRIRRWLFLALVVFGVWVTGTTLRPFPIEPQRASTAPVQVVPVVAYQWAWKMTADSLRAGVPVEFEVTSGDVNHGFAIYDSDDRLLTQTQAMPGVTNRLVHTFARPGKYRVLCLEYCGTAHHVMIREFEVLAGEEAWQ